MSSASNANHGVSLAFVSVASTGSFTSTSRLVHAYNLKKSSASSRRASIVLASASSETVPKSSNVISTPIVQQSLPGTTRVRFAPSPTGSLHVGGARTALYNWLIARQATKKGGDGKFLIRIEDTDLARSTRESENQMLRDLKWLGLLWDEGPEVGGPCGPSYRQSERGDIYKNFAKLLMDAGLAYPCFCTEEELDAKRAVAEEQGLDAKYDGTWRNADPKEVKAKIDRGDPYTVRFRVPAGARVEIEDIVRGHVEWDAEATVGDFILLRSNGVPVYNFCVAVDDALMGVTMVIRAEEHLTNTVRQVLIQRALGFRIPEFAHCSLILGEDRSKLSKRHGATSVDQFRQQGFLADAMINYLALLGWSEGTDKEIYTREELIESFDVHRINKSPAVFDMSKLRWVNGQHLRKLSHESLRDALVDALVSTQPSVIDTHGNDLKSTKTMAVATELFREAMELTNDGIGLLQHAVSYPLADSIQSPDAAALVSPGGGLLEVGKALVAAYENGTFGGDCFKDLSNTSYEAFHEMWNSWVKALGKELGLKGKKLFQPLRLCLTGSLAGRDVGGVMQLVKLAEMEKIDIAGAVNMAQRMEILKTALEKHQQ
eukprot:CAMPEP_0184692040 /NCGR_PEP_ID=MMETSP0313-20130426/678_1 /TAXON_ID=2792 /ORGANISM="Porphyridium aerugineum, Strain SAG 1380-2" /LENGTH=602 /DNA_ID=CAMNT_0027149835 /DNA_START=73 /DNA_END=1881 /DNA_ORIENTATION=-